MIAGLLSKGRNVIIFWVAFLAWGTYLFNFSYYPGIKNLAGNMDLPEESPGFNSYYFYQFLEKLGADGRANYYSFQLIDLFNGVLTGLAIFAALYYFLSRLGGPSFLKALLALPFLAALLDIGENLTIMRLLSGYPQEMQSLVSLAADLTTAKLTMFTVAFLAMISCAAVLIGKFVIRKIRG